MNSPSASRSAWEQKKDEEMLQLDGGGEEDVQHGVCSKDEVE